MGYLVLLLLAAGAQATPTSNPSLRFAELSDAVQQRSTLKRVGPDAESACGESNWSSGTYSLERGGLVRDFRVFVPATYEPTTSAPLILAFHGWGGGD